jgi:hypothetical protein
LNNPAEKLKVKWVMKGGVIYRDDTAANQPQATVNLRLVEEK